MLIFKNSFIKIRKSLGRFFSLIFIVALGSAFFAGVRETSNDMIKTADSYYDEYNLMDFRIVSTMGLTNDDVNSLKELDNVLKVVPGYSFETVVNGDATKIYSYSNEINNVKIIEGRELLAENEILVEKGTYNIGDEIILESDALDFVKNDKFKVVGIVESPMYIYENKGISTVSDGKLDTFMYILPSNFDLDYYTDVYLTAKGSLEETAYWDNYKETIDKLNTELINLKPIRETARYEEIKAEAMKKIYDAQEELEQKKQENEKKFADAKNQLVESEKELQNGWNEYNDGKTTLENTKKEMESLFASKEEEIKNGEQALNESLKGYNISLSEVPNMIVTLEEQIKKLEEIIKTLDESDPTYRLYNEQLNSLKTSLDGFNQIKSASDSLEAGKVELDNGKASWNVEYNNSLKSLNEAYQDLLNGESSLATGKASYETNYATYQAEIAKAEQEIQSARSDVDNLEKPVWYLFDREDNPGYTTFYDAATKVDSIAAVFPLFFILVAFLMGMNTMTRMIEEERSEIGLFVSLGYSKSKIISSYIFYVLIATVIGLVIGLSVGYFVVPIVINRVYVSMFILPELQLYFNYLAALIICLVSFGAMISVTFIAANRNFLLMPANLLRPEAPKKGKKVFLEKIKLLWNHLSFTWKVTVRNLFRYKKRIIMTLIGISGCTALLLTGFGIQDSIGTLMDKQFGEIEVYDGILFLNEEVKETDENINNVLVNNQVNEFTYLNMENYKFNVKNKNIDIYLMAFDDRDVVDNFIHLKNSNNEPISLDDSGVVISSKTAKMLGVNVGDTFEIRNGDNELFVLKIANISNNYVNHYIYMTDNYLKQNMKNDNLNAIMINLDGLDATKVGNNLIASNYFSNIQYTTDSMQIFEDVIRSMKDIVLLIIGFSTFLAITVLYNLTTINISERTREIATLKVLGFHDNEVSAYVYRETLVLTIIGILIGFGFGYLLNQFVMTVAETDEILFVKDIYGLSYLYTFLIMTLFTIIVQFITYFILKKINMIDSLKSVE